MFLKKQQKILCFLIFLAISPFVLGNIKSEANVYTMANENWHINDKSSICISQSKVTQQELDDENIYYYAYLNYDPTDEHLNSLIREARERIIFSNAWTAPGINGYEIDLDGNRVKIPTFYEIFPSNWEIPTLPAQTVDKAYYGLS